jgi:hypothetical protein
VYEGGVKLTGRDEPTGVVLHTCMETTQENSLCSYLYLKLAEILCFFFNFCFSSVKSENRGWNRFCGGFSGTFGKGDVAGKEIGE